MQSIEAGSNLECADCKRTFTSASLLLKHFADHINETEVEDICRNVSDFSHSGNSTLSLLQTKKKARKESILETVLRLSTIQYNVNSPVLPSIFLNETLSNTSSDSFKSGNTGDVIKVDKDDTNAVLSNNMVVEIGQRAKEKLKFSGDSPLIKFDLQKRLENCVLKLQALKHCKEIEPISMKINNKFTEHDSVKYSKSFNGDLEAGKKVECDDFSPLKFCAVSLQEEEDNSIILEEGKMMEMGRKISKGAASRKQLKPKKIHRSQEVLKLGDLKPDILSDPEVKTCQRSSSKRKYVCHVCSKSFGWSTDLKRHILTHTGERPFKCQMCEATFTRNFLLQKHESRVHSVNSAEKNGTREELKESTLFAGNNCSKVELNSAGSGRAIAPKKLSQKKISKSGRVTNGFVRNSVNINPIEDSCDKFSPPKRKLLCDQLSVDDFPRKVFNIL